MIVRCPFTGLYYGDDYSAAHPDATIVGCECWVALHPDGRGGYVTDQFQFQRGSVEHREFHRSNGAVEVILEDGTETLLVLRPEGGWQTRPLPEPVGEVYRLQKMLHEVKSQINLLTEESAYQRAEILVLAQPVVAQPEPETWQKLDLYEAAKRLGIDPDRLKAMWPFKVDEFEDVAPLVPVEEPEPSEAPATKPKPKPKDDTGLPDDFFEVR